jgi:signal transduction histidine kinase
MLRRLMATGARRRVWIVDDSPLDAERARRVLSGAYEIETFCDGSTVLERLTSHAAPDVLVLDWVMPGISGLEVCRFLRSRAGGDAQIGILLLTAHRAVEQIVEGLSAGANDYLAKPYENEELLARVTSQVRARELLERATLAEDSNRRLLEHAPDAMLAVNAHGLLTFVNQEAVRVFGLTREDLLGQPITELLPGLPKPAMWPKGDDSGPLPDVERAGRTYSPTIRLPPAQSSAVATISLRDVTARRKAEARRLDFYSIIAHDLRSPLNTMSLRTQMILNGRHGVLSEGLLADIHKIDGNIRSLVVMINDFLEMARVEASPFTLESSSIDLAALLDAAMEASKPLLESRQLGWQRVVRIPSAECGVIGDAKRLGQVFANLIDNAIKFTPPDGTITTTIQVHGDSVEVAVADTGRGIPSQALPTLFERYTRGPASEGSVAGTGLGLMIVREIVEAHGGSVGVESEIGKGSRFWVRVPRSTRPFS